MRYLFDASLLLVFLMLSGCTLQGLTPASNSSSSTEPSALSAVAPTRIPTQTMAPSPTAIPPTITPTFFPTQTATVSPLPTLEPAQAEEALRILLQEPGDCLAPCFWGITPGQTTLEEAKNIFAHLGLTLELTNVRDNKEFYELIYDFDNGLSISPLLTVQDEMVKNFRIYITPEKSQPGLPRAWLAYAPETLINQYGIPSKVIFSVDRIRDANVPQRTWYYMVMYFAPVDLIVQYGPAEIFPDTKFRACPRTDPFNSVRLWLGKDPEYPPLEDVPVEEAAALTLETFAELMNEKPETACFTLKTELFP
jgi:hypothetical protein